MKIWYKTVTREFVNGDCYERGSCPILTERTLAELWAVYYEEDLSAEDLLNVIDCIFEKESHR